MVTDGYQARGTQVSEIARPIIKAEPRTAGETASRSFFTFTAPEPRVCACDTRAENLSLVPFLLRASPSTAASMIGPQT